MSEKLYYWAENIDGYKSDINDDCPYSIEIKRLNFFIGKNNAGKSRFMRSLFLDQKYKISDFSFPCLTSFFTDLKSIVEKTHNTIWFGSMSSGDNRSKLLQLIQNVINFPPFPRNKYKEVYTGTITQLKNIRIEYDSEFSTIIEEIIQYVSEFDNHLIDENLEFYIPILRGMRPVTDQNNRQPYIERAQKDYFTDTSKFNTENIITGECLYHELKIHLLGEPEQREIIKNYEEKLSQYFFDNEAVSLIPKHDQDVVNIKIGSDRQRPIYELGDGLQQAIILTYEAYIKNKDKEGNTETHAFFIEEPELHMHAGMVRQLMNFYLNETKHYYFFTTHSNHLLDMADESDQVIIQKFVKQPNEDNLTKFDFKIYRCDRDRDLLASLGVRPSSIYLANCTIWVEGITDRLYITKYMQKYLETLKLEEELAKNNEINNLGTYRFRSTDIQRLMPNYHYTFVEYAGSNLTHWDFSDEFTNHLEDCGMNALLTSSSVFLIADGDIKTKNKGMRVVTLDEKLGDKFYLLPCKETENTLPSNIIHYACRIKFLGLNDSLLEEPELKDILANYLSIGGMQSESKNGFDISKLDISKDYFHAKNGIGKIIDDQIKVGNPKPTDDKPKKCFSDQSGTIKEKLKFCRLVLTVMDHIDWELTDSAKELCEKIFEHIIAENPITTIKKTA